jgi:aryl-alcohol dehydrogenase-like predicted oxidoreductase
MALAPLPSLVNALMPCRLFPETGDRISVLGLGTVKFGRNTDVKYPSGSGFPLPTDKEIEALLDLSLELGITVLDTAPAYGTAEERLGNLLGTARREKFFLISKTGETYKDGVSTYDFSAEHTRNSIENSLRRLNTPYLDCVLVHSHRDDIEVIKNTPVLETLALLKQEGVIRSYGVSTYTVAGGKLAAENSDAVMVAYNPNYTAEQVVIDHAHAKGCAVFIKKGLASGHIATPNAVTDSIRFSLNKQGVTSLIIGSLNADNIKKNAAAARSGH